MGAHKIAFYRILPILFVAYLIANIEIANVGFAKFFMNKDLGISESSFGVGAGMFIVAYAIFEIPSVMLATKIGLKYWLFLMMVIWSIFSFLMAFVQSPYEFYILRFFFGVAESGFLSTTMLYFNGWFGKKHKAKLLSLFLLANPLANFLGSPLATWILCLDIALLKNWQWLFVFEALPAFLCGWAVLWLLPKDYKSASWLSASQKAQIAQQLDHTPVKEIFSFKFFLDMRIYLFALIYASVSASSAVFKIWQPSIIASIPSIASARGGLDLQLVGILNALPFGIAMVLMVIYGGYSDKYFKDRKSHILVLLYGLCFSLAGLGLINNSLVVIEIFLCIIIGCVFMFKAPFWAYLSEHIAPQKVGFYLAGINALSNFFGFVATSAVGFIKDKTGDYVYAVLPLLALGILSCLALAIINRLKKI
ncbi:MFS transporter [Helicobacter sp. 11S02596-1]|uniref:MFS transporter n=1 Tax=Helicobacter sp. 11S02596-1 TaxID=1476194 RepID=UPI000BA5A809|nr:MFS transporter [Helicobacter sp. 11S02596-1]PAF41534.1 hypothetical protein BJI48_08420 [Helicobacter sp. 11S02596-1]